MIPVTILYLLGSITLLTLTLIDYIGESVTSESLILSTSDPELIAKLVVNLRALPGCYAQSVPSIIAGFWSVISFPYYLF